MKKWLMNAIELVLALAFLQIALKIFNRLLPEIVVIGGSVSVILLIRAWKKRKDWW